MNSRELAKHFRQVADFLDERGDFNGAEHAMTVSNDSPVTSITFYDKEKFVAAAKVVGNSTKEVGQGEYASFYLHVNEAPLKLSISRDKVCRKKVTFECEPLFSSEELESLGG